MQSTSRINDLGGWTAILDDLTAGQDLTAETTETILRAMLIAEATDAQVAAVIVGMRLKGETFQELLGLQRAMVAAATPLAVPANCADIVGTGGVPSRQTHALNVSTMAAFVAAGAGAVVCKHGSVKASSTSGSFDLLEALGVDVQIGPAQLEAQLNSIGLGFAFARTFHPAMRHVAAVRTQLGIPTMFNILGPLSHPGRVQRQVVGVSDWSVARRVVRVLHATGSIRSLVVVGDLGLDEFSTTGPSRALSLDDGEVTECLVEAGALGLARATAGDLAGGDASTNARITRSILAGEPGPKRDIVVLNAAATLLVAGQATDFQEAVALAANAIDDGRAEAKLSALLSTTW
ncbi:MAG: anthranilate phosphoribosyltransferase [Acidimicrobiia bacterium]|nr:anthranilate phosphoribosyltransferase [Acidimicrobiia bacterium]MCY4457933.1 anthranilate phosphoribosyltransferase [Acidimicrobiaceae bacterium]